MSDPVSFGGGASPLVQYLTAEIPRRDGRAGLAKRCAEEAMVMSNDGSFRLFRVAGIDVFLHWTWLIVAFFLLQFRTSLYQFWGWSVLEYLTLFAIVLLHEFGHALACRQVGGSANRIVLWPLGGIAFVNPPPRPGAVLWSIAAGPLVNVVLVPVTVGLFLLAVSLGELAPDAQGLWWGQGVPDVYRFLATVAVMNLALLVFNLLPIYPLDGGQILQALLWFAIGRARSLLVVSVIGMVVGAAVVLLALFRLEDWWLAILAAFVALRSWSGFQQARLLAKLATWPRHQWAACPSCGVAPLRGPFWGCGHCRNHFDTFEHGAVCPNCGEFFNLTTCPECQQRHPMEEWVPPVGARQKAGKG
jgi:Zn-dependent protease